MIQNRLQETRAVAIKLNMTLIGDGPKRLDRLVLIQYCNNIILEPQQIHNIVWIPYEL